MSQLKRAVELSKERDLSELEEQGIIQSFECSHELAWNLLKDFLTFKGNSNFYGSRDIDLVILGDNCSLKTLYNIEEELEESMLPYKLDLSLYEVTRVG